MERLQKVLAEAGVASRRKCEEIITAGRVQVNGETVKELGVKVDAAQDEITVDGRSIRMEQKVYLLLNKPKGVITSASDPAGRKVVSDFLPGVKERVYPVGRLDYDTEGLLLLTNDGEFANLLTHPKHHVPRTYLATVKGTPHGSLLEQLQKGVKLEDGMTAPAEVDYHDVNPDKNETTVKITIYEGRNRQVRRMFESISFPVIKLRRIQFGPIALLGVPRGKYRHLSPQEIKELRSSAMMAGGVKVEEPEEPDAASRPAWAVTAQPGRKGKTAGGRTAAKPERHAAARDGSRRGSESPERQTAARGGSRRGSESPERQTAARGGSRRSSEGTESAYPARSAGAAKGGRRSSADSRETGRTRSQSGGDTRRSRSEENAPFGAKPGAGARRSGPKAGGRTAATGSGRSGRRENTSAAPRSHGGKAPFSKAPKTHKIQKGR